MQRMSANKPYTISFHPRDKAVATAKAKANGETFSGYLLRLTRADLAKAGITADLPDDELQKKLAEWFEKHGAFDDAKKPRRPARKKKAIEKK